MAKSFASVIVGLGLAVAATSTAQVGEEVSAGRACSFYGEATPEKVVLFASDSEAETVIRRIVEASGLAKNFEVRAAGVPNAAALIQGSRRFILYNQYFMEQSRKSTGSAWAPISIMAHEVGHHLNGHTLEAGGSRPKIELEADYFSGFVLQKMKASLEDARSAMEKLGSPTGSATHPAKHDRLAAITSGWRKACEGDSACRAAGSSAPEPTPVPAPIPQPRPDTAPRPSVDGPDSCEYARDGECDEPNLCRPGTDTTDCRQSRRQRSGIPGPSPRSGFATACMTQAGACSLPPGPIGVVCTCFTPMGPIPGISR